MSHLDKEKKARDEMFDSGGGQRTVGTSIKTPENGMVLGGLFMFVEDTCKHAWLRQTQFKPMTIFS